ADRPSCDMGLTLVRVDAAEVVLKRAARFGKEVFIEDAEVANAVQAEAAEVGTKFAPGGHGPGVAPEEEAQWANGAFRRAAGGVGVGQPELAAGIDGAAHAGEVFDDFGTHVKARRVEGSPFHAGTQAVREGGFDAREGVGCGAGEGGVAPAGNDAGAEDHRLYLLFGEHERGQVEAFAQHVADAGLSFDRDAGEDEVANVAVDGAFRDFQLGGESRGSDDALSPQELDDLEEAVSAPHAGCAASVFMPMIWQ